MFWYVIKCIMWSQYYIFDGHLWSIPWKVKAEKNEYFTVKTYYIHSIHDYVHVSFAWLQILLVSTNTRSDNWTDI